MSKREKTGHRMGEKKCAKDTFDKGLFSKMYKTLLNSNIEKTNIPIKCTKDLSSHLTKEIQMANKYMSHTNQGNATTHLLVWLVSRHNTKCRWECGAAGTLIHCRWGMQNRTAIVEGSLAVCNKIILPYDFTIMLLGIYQKELKICPHKSLLMEQFCCGPKTALKKTKVLIKWKHRVTLLNKY